MSVNNIELRLNEMSLKEHTTAEKWGLQLKDLYQLALSFYKGTTHIIHYTPNYLFKYIYKIMFVF